MLALSEFKEALDKFFMPLVIGKPILEGTTPVDFEVLYTNDEFKSHFGKLTKEGDLFSKIKPNLSEETFWTEVVKEALLTKTSVTHTFFSTKYSCWFRITMNTVGKDLVTFSILDISNDKEHEQQLKRQNLRLASLTEELSESKENLHEEFNNIENLNKELAHIAYHDTATGLLNRQKLMEDLTRCGQNYANGNGKFGIILIDLDNMKFINDSRGHSAGDAVICNAADILHRFERNEMHSYKFGGDEFVVLCENLTSKDTILNIGDAILEAFNSDGIEFSGGIAIFPDDTKDPEELLKFADMAMYDVKRNGRNNVSFFQNVMQEKFLARLNIQARLSDALINNNFQLYYQPQFDVASGNLRGFEALLRWHDETLGWINPEQFISIAEESHLVVPLGEWVMDTALATLHDWVEKFNFAGIMSINVSPIQLKKPDFLFNLTNKIKEHKINTKQVELEITEGVMIDNKEEIIKLLSKLRDMGIGISLDDFGTGYSSLSYLQLLPITTLKIDKSFIANITAKDGVEANITDSIVSMVTKMGLDTIAEGVEKPEQLNILKSINCKTIQGFLKAKPMSIERCNAMLSGDESAILTIQNDN